MSAHPISAHTDLASSSKGSSVHTGKTNLPLELSVRMRPDVLDDDPLNHRDDSQKHGSPVRPRRIDLHCHSIASTEADEAVLNVLQCPESYSEPAAVYAQAKKRGMDLVTLTDHDTLNGVQSLLAKPGEYPGVFTGEELTCYFPEDGCKMHVLIWGVTQQDHEALQAAAHDIYHCAQIIEERRIAHAVAHPLYRQNDKLERWHIERLMLLFKGFETLNGAHSALHRQAFEPLLEELCEDKIARLSRLHNLAPRWPKPWIKARTGGSDDHGLFNLGRTWTEFPGDVATVEDVLACLREGRCAPGGEAGSSLKLAHNFYGVALRYYDRIVRTAEARNPATTVLDLVMQLLVGDRLKIRKRDLARALMAGAVRNVKTKVVGGIRGIFRRRSRKSVGTALLRDLFVSSCRKRMGDHQPLKAALSEGFAPLGEHREMFSFISGINRDIAGGVADAIGDYFATGKIAGVFDAIGTVTAHQFVLLPYYFSLFHQNRERAHLGRITRQGAARSADIGRTMRVGVFTDTLDQPNGIGRFVRTMAHEATNRGFCLIVHTCGPDTDSKGRHDDHPYRDEPYRKNFQPMVQRALPQLPELTFTLPPVIEVLEWADRQQFDAIHVDTPGPMGLCGLLVARMLHIPLLGTYHVDYPAYVKALTGDFRLTSAVEGYISWFYGRMNTILSRSRRYEQQVRSQNLGDIRYAMSPACFDPSIYNPERRDARLIPSLGLPQKHALLYVGRLSAEKNVALLVACFKQLCQRTGNVALIMVGDGPCQAQMELELAGLPVRFLGYQTDEQLAALYASSDLLVLPSITETLGQVVIEAQACGLPVVVSDQGGPREAMDDNVTGLVIASLKPSAWANAIEDLLLDETRRQRMARTAPHRVSRFTVEKAFDAFWSEHTAAVGRVAATLDAAPFDIPQTIEV